MRCNCHAPDVWLHATADIQQQDDVNRHLLALEIPDLLGLSIHSQDEILSLRSRMGWFPPSTTWASTRPNETSLRKVMGGSSACGFATAAVGAANRHSVAIGQKDVHALHRRPLYEPPLDLAVWARLFRLRCSGAERGGKFLLAAAPECNQYYPASSENSSAMSASTRYSD